MCIRRFLHLLGAFAMAVVWVLVRASSATVSVRTMRTLLTATTVVAKGESARVPFEPLGDRSLIAAARVLMGGLLLAGT